MKILMILSYYYPYISGISEYAKRLSEKLVKRGHKVTVLTSKHDRNLKGKEKLGGVDIIRCHYVLKVSKGVVMPAFIYKAIKLSKDHDIVNIHMPMMEAGILCKLIKDPIITYHCDLKLDNRFRIIQKIYDISADIALKDVDNIITYTKDYAKNSRSLKKQLDKCRYIYPPIEESHFKRKDPKAFKAKNNISSKIVIGFAGRIVYEKGIDYILRAIPDIIKRYPDTIFALAGEYKEVAGGNVLYKLRGPIDKNKKHIRILGNISYKDLPYFYSSCDILLLPSIDPLEAFGIVQIESMYCGTPVVASDLPGVRVPVKKTGMGKIIRKKDQKALAYAIIEILKNKKSYIKSRKRIVEEFGIKKTIDFYEAFFDGQI